MHIYSLCIIGVVFFTNLMQLLGSAPTNLLTVKRTARLGSLQQPLCELLRRSLLHVAPPASVKSHWTHAHVQ